MPTARTELIGKWREPRTMRDVETGLARIDIGRSIQIISYQFVFTFDVILWTSYTRYTRYARVFAQQPDFSHVAVV